MSAADAGRALVAWATAIQDASIIIDPSAPIQVDLLGTETACLRLHAALRFFENRLERGEAALAPYPRVKAFLALNVFSLPGVIIGGVLGAGVVEIVKDQLHDASPQVQQAAKQATRRLANSPIVASDVRQFYRALEGARNVTGVTIYESSPNHPIIHVPRDQFAEGGGLWLHQEQDVGRRPKQAVWDVIVTHPAIISKPRVWRFRRDGLPFKAKLLDPYFLAAIRDHTLPMQIAEGSLMRVQIEFFEILRSGEWEADTNSFVISRVLWPSPLASPLPIPLFPEVNPKSGDGDARQN